MNETLNAVENAMSTQQVYLAWNALELRAIKEQRTQELCIAAFEAAQHDVDMLAATVNRQWYRLADPETAYKAVAKSFNRMA